MKRGVLIWFLLLAGLGSQCQVISAGTEYMRTYFPNRLGSYSIYKCFDVRYQFMRARRSTNWGIGVIVPFPRDRSEREEKEWKAKRRGIYGGLEISKDFRYDSGKSTELRTSISARYVRGYFESYLYIEKDWEGGFVYKKNAFQLQLMPASVQLYHKRSRSYLSVSPFIAGTWLFGEGDYHRFWGDRDIEGKRIRVRENPVCFTLGTNATYSFSFKRIRKK